MVKSAKVLLADLEQHGTVKGYNLHRKEKTVVCRPCQNAENERKRDYTLARYAALERLRRAHPEEFAGLLAEERARRAS
jgi:hypothetical protein